MTGQIFSDNTHAPSNRRDGLGYATLWIQPKGSGRLPYWIPISSDRRRIVTGPGSPDPIVQPPDVPSTEPTGVITAAVPQANTSVSEPEAHASRHSWTEILPSFAGTPSVGASLSSESLVIPGRSEPVRAGVMMVAAEPEPCTKYRFMPPISSTHWCSAASSQTTWSQPLSTACCCAANAA